MGQFCFLEKKFGKLHLYIQFLNQPKGLYHLLAIVRAHLSFFFAIPKLLAKRQIINQKIKTYIPDRKTEGYGPSIKGFTHLINNGVKTKIGNTYSLQNKELPVEDKFSLGGRWLRGFDSFGVGPRESRSSYVGGQNILAAKIDKISIETS